MDIDYLEDIKEDIEEARSNGFSEQEIEDYLTQTYGEEKMKEVLYPQLQKVELVGAKIVTIKGKDGKRGPKGLKGDKGDTPKKGKDYFTEKEIQEFKKEVTPQKGVDYFDGEDGEDGESIIGPQGEKGERGEKGEKGDKIKHRWIGTTLQFENPDGTWGEAVQLAPGLYTFENRGLSRGGGLPLTTKGDIVVFNGNEAIRLAIGNNGQVLTVDSNEAAGLKWANPTGGAGGHTIQEEGSDLTART